MPDDYLPKRVMNRELGDGKARARCEREGRIGLDLSKKTLLSSSIGYLASKGVGKSKWWYYAVMVEGASGTTL